MILRLCASLPFPVRYSTTPARSRQVLRGRQSKQQDTPLLHMKHWPSRGQVTIAASQGSPSLSSIPAPVTASSSPLAGYPPKPAPLLCDPSTRLPFGISVRDATSRDALPRYRHCCSDNAGNNVSAGHDSGGVVYEGNASGNKVFMCDDGSRQVPCAALNDDYCDCMDGSDETLTSACSNGYFYCNAGARC